MTSYAPVSPTADSDEDESLGLLQAGSEADVAPSQLCSTGREYYNNLRGRLSHSGLGFNDSMDLKTVVLETIETHNHLTNVRDTRTNTARVTLVVFNLLALLFMFVAFVVGASSASARAEMLTFAMFGICCSIVTVVVASVNSRGDNAWVRGTHKRTLVRTTEQIFYIRNFVRLMLDHFVQDKCVSCATHSTALVIYETTMYNSKQSSEVDV